MIAGVVQNQTPAGLPFISGRYYGPNLSAGLTTLALAQDTMYFQAIYLPTDTTLAGLAAFPTVAVSINAHMGLYADNGAGKPGALVTGTDITIAPLTAASKNDFTFVAPILVPKGWYWIALDVSGTSTFTAKSGTEPSVVGDTTLYASGSTLGVKVTASSTFGALPTTAPSVTLTDGASAPYMALKVN